MKRGMSVAGSFYPDSADEIKRYFNHFTKVYDDNLELPKVNTKAVIVPHAGYIYSGFTANIAYRLLKQSGVKDFLVIGPSHRVAFDGFSLCGYDSYDTPFGEIKSAEGLYKKLYDNFLLKCVKEAHMEHSTEVQFPFIKYYLDGANIIELVYSDASPEYLCEVIEFALKQDNTGVIISTDLSHFYKLDDANRLDSICLSAVDKLDVGELSSGCQACGIIGVKAMMLCAKEIGLESSILDYRTSADASGDKSRVVGYMSAYFS